MSHRSKLRMSHSPAFRCLGMGMGWVEMSERELRRADVLAAVFAGRLTMTAAADLMGVTRRQAHRLARLFEAEGAAGLRHRARGRPSKRLLGPHVQQLAQGSPSPLCATAPSTGLPCPDSQASSGLSGDYKSRVTTL